MVDKFEWRNSTLLTISSGVPGFFKLNPFQSSEIRSGFSVFFVVFLRRRGKYGVPFLNFALSLPSSLIGDDQLCFLLPLTLWAFKNILYLFLQMILHRFPKSISEKKFITFRKVFIPTQRKSSILVIRYPARGSFSLDMTTSNSSANVTVSLFIQYRSYIIAY